MVEEAQAKKAIWDTIQVLPISLIFLLVIASMIIPAMYPLGLPIPITKMTQDTFSAVDQLAAGSYLWIDNAYGSGTIAVHEPGLVCVLRHAIQKQLKIVLLSTGFEGVQLFPRVVTAMQPDLQKAGYVEGKNWVHLGYIPGGEAVWSTLLIDIFSIVNKDWKDRPFDQLPLMVEIKNRGATYNSIDLFYSQTAGGEVVEGWIRQVHTRYHDVTGVKVITQILEMMVPAERPFYNAGSLAGIMNGAIGAAEYELLVKRPGEALKVTDMLSISQLIVLFFWALGNIGFVVVRRRRGS